MEITLLANAGVLIEGAGVRVMVDGLYRAGDSGFQALPPEMESALMAGNPPVDLLACTHLHPDHFSAPLLRAYLERNRVGGVLLPGQSLDPVGMSAGRAARTWLAGQNIPFRVMDQPIGGGGSWAPMPGVSVRWFNTGHMGPQFAGESNNCLLLTLGGGTVLLTGDADENEGLFRRALVGQRVDAVLINPLFGQSAQGRTILRAWVKPALVVHYHIPAVGSDPWGLRRMVERQLERCRGEGYAQAALWEPGQRVIVPTA